MISISNTFSARPSLCTSACCLNRQQLGELQLLGVQVDLCGTTPRETTSMASRQPRQHVVKSTPVLTGASYMSTMRAGHTKSVASGTAEALGTTTSAAASSCPRTSILAAYQRCRPGDNNNLSPSTGEHMCH